MGEPRTTRTQNCVTVTLLHSRADVGDPSLGCRHACGEERYCSPPLQKDSFNESLTFLST